MLKNGFTLGILLAAIIALTGCKKEEGPVGPQGPAGPAGDDANYTMAEYLVEAGDFQVNYAEIEVDIITEDILNDGVVLVYVLDNFGYWNNVPSQFSPITGFSFTWNEDDGGLLGLDHDPDATISDYDVRVVTMFQRSYEDLPSDEIVKDYEELMDFLEKK